MEESEEINACSIVVPVTIDGKEEEWLVNFKNETHNHPTESSPSAARLPVWAEPSGTPCPGGPMCIRPCV